MDAYGQLYKYTAGNSLLHTDFIFRNLEHSEMFSTYDDVARDLTVEHFGINEIPEEITEYISDKNYNNDIGYRQITARELRKAVRCQTSSKVPDWDNIDQLIVKYLCNKFLELIKASFNKCQSLGHFPKSWRKGLVILFRKKNKSPKSAIGYRPITLLPVLAKILERI